MYHAEDFYLKLLTYAAGRTLSFSLSFFYKNKSLWNSKPFTLGPWWLHKSPATPNNDDDSRIYPQMPPFKIEKVLRS